RSGWLSACDCVFESTVRHSVPNQGSACPNGSLYFNSTGNPGMATAGSGDTLTGILLGLLSQGYTPKNTCLIGVFLHGLAGDLAALDIGETSLMASDIIRELPNTFQVLEHLED
ncbi:MAG: NAD(P)H-hydrate dehydratase, partial [Bacteroidota bacterium]